MSELSRETQMAQLLTRIYEGWLEHVHHGSDYFPTADLLSEVALILQPRSWDDATPLELVEAEVQSLREGLQHLKDCVKDAFTLTETRPGAPVRPEVALDEEWSS